jgi:hypothetical protein
MPRDAIIVQALGAVFGVVGAGASLIIWFGMVVFCVCEDRSTFGTKIFWFILFFALAWFGAATYFFKVYRKQVDGAGRTLVPRSGLGSVGR